MAWSDVATDRSLDLVGQIFVTDLLNAGLRFAQLGDAAATNGTGTVSALGAVLMIMAAMTVAVWWALLIALRAILVAAEHGTAWKSMSPVWAPMRVTTAVVLSTPILGGYSILQGVIAAVVAISVGVANLGWTEAVNKISMGGLNDQVATPDARELALNLFGSYVCAFALQRDLVDRNYSSAWGAYWVGKIDQGEAHLQFGTETPNTGYSKSTCGEYVLRAGALTDAELEGVTGGMEQSMSTAKVAQTLKTSVFAWQIGAVNTMLGRLQPLAHALVNEYTVPSPAEIDAAARDWSTYLKTQVAALIQSQEGWDAWKTNATKDGWIYAGAWQYRMASLDSAIRSSVAAMPTQTRTTVPWDEIDEYAKRQLGFQWAAYEGFRKKVREWAHQQAGTDQQMTADLQALGDNGDIGDKVSAVVLAKMREWLAMDPNADPIVGAKRLGELMIDAAWVAAGVSAVSGAVSKIAEFAGMGGKGPGLDTLGSATGTMASVAVIIAVAFAVPGAFLAFYLPLIPALLWLGAVANWLVLIIEVIVAAPLMALSHIEPEGEGFASQRAMQGWMIVLDVLYRPVVMVAGLVASMAVSSLFVRLLNEYYWPLFISTRLDNWSGLVTFLAGGIIYVVLVVGAIHKLYDAINSIPAMVMKMVGSSLSSGDGHEIERRTAGVITGVGGRAERTGEKAAGAAVGGGRSQPGAKQSGRAATGASQAAEGDGASEASAARSSDAVMEELIPRDLPPRSDEVPAER